MTLLDQQLSNVASRFRRLDWWQSIATAGLLVAGLGGALLLLQLMRIWMNPFSGWVLLGTAAAAFALVTLASLGRFRDERKVAKNIEEHFPELEQRLITTMDEAARNHGKPLGFLQHMVMQETVTHARHNPWAEIIPMRSIQRARGRGLVGLCLVMGISLALMKWQPPMRTFAFASEEISDPQSGPADFDIQVEPGHAEVELGSNFIVVARFGKQIPKSAELVVDDGVGETRFSMSQSLDDPLFGGTVPGVQQDMEYHVLYDGRKSPTYRVSTFTYPQLVRADALLEFPSYTSLGEKRLEDTRRVSVVQGTRLTWAMHLNKPGVKAKLVPVEPGDEVPLQLDSTNDQNHLVSFELQETTSWKLVLQDAAGRLNRNPPTVTAKVTPNRPPKLKLEVARDVRVSPLEEFLVKATVSDDYGLKKFGLSYTLASASPQDVVLGAESGAGREKRIAEHLLAFEELEASPDELLSYYFWAEDEDAQGNARRLESDMFFAEVRHFEEIFRQGEQPPGGQQQQQQQQQQQSQNAGDAEQLAELQKQIINASWRLIRRETAETVTPVFEEDVATLIESQQTAAEQLRELGQNLQDQESRQHLLEAQAQVQVSTQQLTSAYSDNIAAPLRPAMDAQRSVYQALLKLRAREHEVTQGQPQSSSPSSQSSSRSRFQQQLQQLQLKNDQNRYETQRQAEAQEDQEQTEVRQALSRLRELAQRQEDLNEQLQELQSALERAESEEERLEIERQLKRLREQQQEMLRDADELMERLDENQDQETLQETRDQLEQTRERMRESAESLEQREVTPALASGARAQRELEEMREELRRESANQFTEQMQEMRDEARKLEQQQEEIGQRLEQQTEAASDTGLRADSQRDDALSDALREQNDRLKDLLREMEETVREAEESEPLLAEGLYDAFRQTENESVQRNLETAAELSERGFDDQAQRLEEEARQGISNLRENVEQAAEGVLGDETDALRTAVRMLEDLERQLDDEIGQFDQESGSNPPANQRQPGDRSTGEEPGSAERQDDRGGDETPSDQPRENADATSSDSDSTREEGEEGTSPNQQQSRDASDRPESQDSPPQQPGQANGQQPNSSTPRSDEDSPGEARPGEAQPSGESPSGESGENPSTSRLTPQQLRAADRQPRQEGGGPGGFETSDVAPITGDDFRQWSDRLRDVEEIVSDPELRAEATRIREQARSFRREFKRGSKEPKWDLVRELVSRPLRGLRKQVSEELMRRSAEKNAIIPLDRDPVPDQFTEQVRQYYENLGSGK